MSRKRILLLHVFSYPLRTLSALFDLPGPNVRFRIARRAVRAHVIECMAFLCEFEWGWFNPFKRSVPKISSIFSSETRHEVEDAKNSARANALARHLHFPIHNGEARFPMTGPEGGGP